MASSIQSLLENISGVVDNPVEQLRSLKTAILSVPASGLRDAAARDGRWLDAVFSLLHTDDGEQIELCADVLRHTLPALGPAHAARTLRSELRAGLIHPVAAVKTLALTQVSWMAGDAEAAAELLKDRGGEVLREVVRCVGSEETRMAKEAVGSLVKLCCSQGGSEALFSRGSLLDGLEEVMAVGDVPRCRVYELAIDVASTSAAALGRCADSGVLARLLDELTGDDVLIRATAIGMVTTLAHSQHGRQFLALRGIMDEFSGMIRGADADALSSLYLPGLVTFFGTLAVAEGPRRVCERYPAFQDKVLEMALGADLAMTGVAVDTLGLLGSDGEGKRVLQGTGEKFAAVLSRMGRLAASGAAEMRVRCLESVARLLGLREQQQAQPDLLALTESWFRLLADDPMDAMAKVAAQPFPELSCAALRVLASVAPQPWAQRMMIGTPGFMEFAVGRAAGRTKEVKDGKFKLVKALANSSTAASVLGSQHYLHLKSYLREGPYYVYVLAGAAVATEEAE